MAIENNHEAIDKVTDELTEKIIEESNCKHVNEKGLTTIYKAIDDIPDITCTLCNEKLTISEYQERVEYVAKCYEEGKPYV